MDHEEFAKRLEAVADRLEGAGRPLGGVARRHEGYPLLASTQTRNKGAKAE